jgi:mRNA-degrading endonuclease RelE of RelBE toxin-antitoxin system
MQVLLEDRVKLGLSMLSADDRNRTETWFGYLRNWEDDPFVKSRSVELSLRDSRQLPIHLFRTSTDVRIFYSVDVKKKTIHVIDVTTEDTILSFGGVRVGA